MPKEFKLPKPIQRHEANALRKAAPRIEGGADHVGSSIPRHRTHAQRMQQELAEARAREDEAKGSLAPSNVRLMRTWENLDPWERTLIENEIDARQRARARLDAYGPDPISDLDLYYGAPEKFHS
jgi:hypothetical protein